MSAIRPRNLIGERLSAYQAQTGESWAQIARNIGVDASVLSAFRKKPPEGASANRPKIVTFLDRFEGKCT